MLCPLISLALTARAVSAQIAALSWGENRIDVFGTTFDSDSTIWHKYFTQHGGWEPSDKFENLGGPGTSFLSLPVVTSWGTDRLDFFAVGEGNVPYHKYWDGSKWAPQDLEVLIGDTKAQIFGDLAAASWSPGRIDVIGRGKKSTYVHLFWDGHQWNGWEDVWGQPAKGLAFASSPAIVSWGENRFDVFGVAENGSVYHKFWAGDHYEPAEGWERLGWQEPSGGFKNSTISATSWGDQRMDVWAIGTDGALYHTLWDHDYHGPWESLGGNNLTSAPAVTHWAPNRIDIVGVDGTAGLLYKFWDGYGWRPDSSSWYAKSANLTSPAATTWGPNNLNIFAIDPDGKLQWQAWNQSYWIPSADKFITLGDAEHPFKGSSERAGKLRPEMEQIVIEDFKTSL